MSTDLDGFNLLYKQHQERSRQANQKKFAGGLADHSERTTQLHTATHLLHQALRDVLGTHVYHTSGMGRFRIIKAETIGQGVQRIRADLVEAVAAQNS